MKLVKILELLQFKQLMKLWIIGKMVVIRMMRMTRVMVEKVFWRSSFVEVLCKLLLTQSIAQCRISTSFPPLLDAIQHQKYPRAGLTNNQTALCTIRVLSILGMIHTLIDLSETISNSSVWYVDRCLN